VFEGGYQWEEKEQKERVKRVVNMVKILYTHV
jgi:hypothetical protein